MKCLYRRIFKQTSRRSRRNDTTPEGDEIRCMIQLDFPTTNNKAEYEALVARLDLAKTAGAENIVVHCDSQVVTSQINGGYECKNERMKRYLEEVKY